jgi:peroxiredoxin
MTIMPRREAPTLAVETLEHGMFNLSDQRPKTFSMIVFYRGRHCGFCRRYLQDLKIKSPDFTRRGVEFVAVSMDPKERAQEAAVDWELRGLPIGYGLSAANAVDWELFLSSGIKEDQPELFCEPALFLIKPDRTIYAATIQNLPWARPRFEDVLFMIDFLAERSKPARGEVFLNEATLAGRASALA